MSQPQPPPHSEPFRTYDEALGYMYGRINYERVRAETFAHADFKLDRMGKLLQFAGDPHLKIPAVHVAGTKGKGSTCRMLAGILSAAGYRTGLYTSPHIERYEERFTVDGVMPAPDDVCRLVNQIRPLVEQMDALLGSLAPTYFEMTTLMAWLHFAQQQCQIVVLEVGMGGRLDSTNLCAPLVTAITNVSRDHTQILGSTVTEIAREKAGIAKRGVPLITASENPDVLKVVRELTGQTGAPLKVLGDNIAFEIHETPSGRRVQVGDSLSGPSSTPISSRPLFDVPLAGAHQARNTALAVALVHELRAQHYTIPDDAIVRGLGATQWPARIEVVAKAPITIVDAAHNWESVKALVSTLDTDFVARRRILVFGTTRDKDAAGLLEQLLPAFGTVILTRYQENPRSLPVHELATLVSQLGPYRVHQVDEPIRAWELAMQLATEADLIVVTGSFFLVSEVRPHILKRVNL